MQQLSEAQLLASLPEAERQKALESLTDEVAAHLRYNWDFWARPNQKIPFGPWTYWLLKAGRGFGKTRVGAETVRIWARTNNYVNLIGATADDARDIMIEGESGILAICPTDERPIYRKSERKLIWPNGGTSLIFTADEPERLRGKQHAKLWPDELAAWRYPAAWDQAMFGLRLGDNPQAVVTTTPKPIKIIRDLVADPDCIVTSGTSYDNRANLTEKFFNTIITKYEGTRLGRQELMAELLEDVPNALWTVTMLDNTRILGATEIPDMQRVIIGVDPSGAGDDSAGTSAEIGIVIVGLGTDGHAYIQEDLTLAASPAKWGGVVAGAFDRHGADLVVGEVNYGGGMVEFVIRAAKSDIAYKAVTATRGKVIRAEPIAALYEQGKVHHVGNFEKLEAQMCMATTTGYVGDASPDRLDALVWALTELFPGMTKKKYEPVPTPPPQPGTSTSWMG